MRSNSKNKKSSNKTTNIVSPKKQLVSSVSSKKL